MVTITETITGKLLDGVNDPHGLQSVLQEYNHSKGPLYIALAEATSIMTQKLTTSVQKYQEQEIKLQQQHQLLQVTEKKLQDIDLKAATESTRLDSLEGKVQEKKTLVDEIKTVSGLGLGIKELVKFHDLLVKIGALQGISPAEINKLFFNYVSKFQDAAALETQIQQLTITAATCKAKVEHRQAEMKAAEMKTKVRKSSIETTEKILAHDVKELDLPHWAHILEKAKISAEGLSQELDQVGSLEKLIQDRQQKADRLETLIKSLDAQVQALNDEREEVSDAIVAVRDRALAEVEAMSQKARENLNALMLESENYKKLQEEAAALGNIVTLAKAIRGNDPDIWSQIGVDAVRTLLSDMLLWCKADPSHNLDLETPTGSFANKLAFNSLYKITLLEVLTWARKTL
jgi:hypothetical protein